MQVISYIVLNIFCQRNAGKPVKKLKYLRSFENLQAFPIEFFKFFTIYFQIIKKDYLVTSDATNVNDFITYTFPKEFSLCHNI